MRQRWRCVLKWQRVISLVTLAISLFTLVLVLRKPAPVAAPVSPAATAANVQSFQEKVDRLEQPAGTASGGEVRLTSGELTAAIAQATGMMPAAASSTNAAAPASSSTSGGAPEFPGAVPNIKDYQVAMDGDVVRGQFLTNIAGKDVYLTLAAHLGSKDGYATFDATEVKVGDLNVPVSLVNDALQKKLAEQRDQLKLPNNVKDLKVQNGELVFVEK